MRANGCHVCGVSLSGSQRKFCRAHGKLASTLWKREQRRTWAARGDAYWHGDWKHKTPDERRAYFREYMRKYRGRQKGGDGDGRVSLQPNA